MTIGSYGSIVFQVSSSVAETFKDLQYTTEAKYSEHAVHGQKAVREFTGFGSDQISFNMTLSAFNGINPKKELDKLKEMMKSKKAYSLVLGTDLYGSWTIEAISESIQYTWQDGTLLQCEVGVTLFEGAST